MSSHSSKEIKFIDFCKLLESIRSTPKQVLKEQKLREFYKEYRKKGEEIKRNDSSADTSFFPVLRLLLPQLERERSAYGLNKFGLKKMITKILSLPKGDDSSKRLSSDQYDFVETAYSILRKSFCKSKDLSVFEINEHLDLIAQKQSENQVSHQERAFLKLFESTSPEEQKWIIRIILKKMNLGLAETKILNIYHPNASVLLNNTNSLLTVCDTLNDPNVVVNDLEIDLFTPIRPMLSKRCDAKELFKSVTESQMFIVETKFDGERFQLHMENDRFKYFSRGGYDFTKKFGESYSTGLYTPLLKGVFSSNVKSILLDGEMMGWNKNKEEFGSKGMNFDVKNLTDTSVHQPCFCVFDILLLNGELLTNKPLNERMNILKDIFIPRKGIILHSTRIEVYTKQDIINALNNSMDKKEEGIVYKDPNSRYVPNVRNGGWWKVKLEYFSGVMSDLDVIIMGGFYGRGKKIDSFIVGVSVPSDTGSSPKKYLSLAKITAGLSLEEWNSIRKYLDPHWIKMVENDYETYGLDFGKMKPDVWVQPKRSCILLIRATELTKNYKSNSNFKTSYTLRFPRIESIRFDKPYYDCLAINELDELASTSQPVEKLYKKHLKLEDIEYEFKKTKKFRAKFIDTNVYVEEKVSSVLKDYEFCVLSGTSVWKVEEIEKTIKENGGNIVKAERENKTYCILAGEKHSRLDYYKGSVDVVKLSWLQKVLDCRKMFAYCPEDMIYTTDKTKYRFIRNYDKYGDSYTDKATKYSLENVFNNIKEKGDYLCLLSNEIDDLHKEIKYEKRINLFNDYIVYFDKYKTVNDPLSDIVYDSTLEELVLKFWGGQVASTLTENVNTVITYSSDTLRSEELLAYIPGGIQVNIVDKSFLYGRISQHMSSSNF